MPRIDPSRQDSMSESILRFYHNQNWAKIEFYMKFGRKSTKFHVFQINLIIRFVGYFGWLGNMPGRPKRESFEKQGMLEDLPSIITLSETRCRAMEERRFMLICNPKHRLINLFDYKNCLRAFGLIPGQINFIIVTFRTVRSIFIGMVILYGSYDAYCLKC